MVRLCAIVSLVSGERAGRVFRRMPLRLVHHYECAFYLREGMKVRRRNQETLEEMMLRM